MHKLTYSEHALLWEISFNLYFSICSYLWSRGLEIKIKYYDRHVCLGQISIEKMLVPIPAVSGATLVLRGASCGMSGCFPGNWRLEIKGYSRLQGIMGGKTSFKRVHSSLTRFQDFHRYIKEEWRSNERECQMLARCRQASIYIDTLNLGKLLW